MFVEKVDYTHTNESFVFDDQNCNTTKPHLFKPDFGEELRLQLEV
ncbi:hypothetical protein SAMN04488059_1672 [Devosia psychrophila]|uniref:Uncharacterized protein n=1 Tax=Devosia psychrophila TaxID=728005 RepID=A0A1I1SGQ5_9HYPH|nr:hypothetical protein SAMN04488059_1672 [Devosia psychrophila]